MEGLPRLIAQWDPRPHRLYSAVLPRTIPIFVVSWLATAILAGSGSGEAATLSGPPVTPTSWSPPCWR